MLSAFKFHRPVAYSFRGIQMFFDFETYKNENLHDMD